MFNMFSSSVRSGVNSVSDFSAGIKAERVRTGVITRAMLNYRAIDVLLQSIGSFSNFDFGFRRCRRGNSLFHFIELDYVYFGRGSSTESFPYGKENP